MDGYLDLTQYYDALFPPSEGLKVFLERYVEASRRGGRPWLEVGAGVGGLADWLTNRQVSVWALEPAPEFVDAIRRRLGPLTADRARRGGMEDVASFLADERWEIVTCLGNVAAHAASRAALADFMAACARRLAPTGKLIVQTVNFDRILARGEAGFPTLERRDSRGRPFTFDRDYDLSDVASTGTVAFHTVLAAPEATIRNSTRLLAVRRAELLEMAQSGGFARVRTFGDFDERDWTPDAPATILLAGVQ